MVFIERYSGYLSYEEAAMPNRLPRNRLQDY